MATKTVIITGGFGFIGHHVVEHLYKNTNWNIIVLDKLNYASRGYLRLKDTDTLDSSRVRVFTCDLAAGITEGLAYEIGQDIDYLIHMAAETHVDRSIKNPVPFIENNINSTVKLLEYARTLKNLDYFVYFSTDEVFGPALNGKAFKEWDPHRPTNPYSASKSAAEGICLAYQNTYRVPVFIVNVMNVFGEKQHIEKFIPSTIKKVLAGEEITIHTYPDGKTPGSRFYIHARNVAAAVLFLLGHPDTKIGDKYNITGEKEVDNLQLASLIANNLDKTLKYRLVDFHTTRPGHDCRYSLDGTKMEKMGWKLPINFESGLSKVIKWTIEHPEWLN